MMSLFVDSLKRLYQTKLLSLEQLKKLLYNKKITKTEYDYILSEEV